MRFRFFAICVLLAAHLSLAQSVVRRPDGLYVTFTDDQGQVRTIKAPEDDEVEEDGQRLTRPIDGSRLVFRGAAVEADLTEAAALGVNATPTTALNDRLVPGSQPLETFVQTVDAELEALK